MKKSLILYIDTSSRDTKAQNTLPLIKKLLKEGGYKLQDVKEIKVNTGPGSFVGLRVGVTIANTLAFLLNIPVNGKKPPVLPHYQI